MLSLTAGHAPSSMAASSLGGGGGLKISEKSLPGERGGVKNVYLGDEGGGGIYCLGGV